MELNDLIGEHLLSGVDSNTEAIKRYGYVYEDCEVIRFVLDEKTYKATENPDDGYRSYLNDIDVTDEKVTNNFPPQKVFAKMKENGAYSVNNTIQFFDAITTLLVLEIGTDNTDDYYPYCVMRWLPENMAVNIGK